MAISLSWEDKYRPNNVSDLIGNHMSVEKIDYWMKNFNENRDNYFKKIDMRPSKKDKSKKSKNVKPVRRGKLISDYSSICLIGNHGIGKSYAIDVLANKNGYTVKRLGLANAVKNSTTALKNLSSAGDVLNLMNGNKDERELIVIDKLETISSTTEKSYITNILKENGVSWLYPIVFICNSSHNKFISSIKKDSYEIRFYNPYRSDLMKLLTKISKGETIQYDSHDTIDEIIDYSQHDIRRLVNVLHDLKFSFGNAIITTEMFAKYKRISQKKDIDYDLFNAAEGLLYDYKNVDSCLRFYETEKVLLPLMVHQYYTKCITNNHKDPRKQYELATEISDSLSWGDIVENIIYGDQNWNMQEIHGFFTCANTSYNLCRRDEKEKDVDMKKCSLIFAADLNKASIKCINKKNIVNAAKCFKNMGIIDYIYTNKIIRKLIEQNRIEECCNILKGYDIKIEHIESLLKIDKIKSNDIDSKQKASLSSKQKKEFEKYLN